MSTDSLFNIFINTLKNTLKTWDYYINWTRIIKNIEPIEKELYLLNSLIGKTDIKEKFIELVKEYPNVLKAIPILLAIREDKIEVLIDTRNFIYERYNFNKTEITDKEIEKLSVFLINSGLAEMLTNRKIKSLVDYVLGVEVGMDTNARKNRGGTIMEDIVEMHIADLCNTMGYDYIKQGTKNKIKEKWGINIKIEESERSIDFVIKGKNNKLYFIEVNFYSGGGSKLKVSVKISTGYRKKSNSYQNFPRNI
jgi:type II restriction enzyme